MSIEQVNNRIAELSALQQNHAAERSKHDKAQRELGKQIAKLQQELIGLYSAATTSPTTETKKR